MPITWVEKFVGENFMTCNLYVHVTFMCVHVVCVCVCGRGVEKCVGGNFTTCRLITKFAPMNITRNTVVSFGYTHV